MLTLCTCAGYRCRGLNRNTGGKALLDNGQEYDVDVERIRVYIQPRRRTPDTLNRGPKASVDQTCWIPTTIC